MVQDRQAYLKKYREDNRLNNIVYQRDYQARNADRLRALRAAKPKRPRKPKRLKTLEEKQETLRRYREENRERRRQWCLDWAKNNPEKHLAKVRKYQTSKMKRTPPWADLAAIIKFYEDCPEGLHVDHIIPLKGKLVSGLHVANNLQYLSKSENSRKGNRFTPIHDIF